MAFGRGDPNADVYDAAAGALAGMTDAAGRRLRVARIPSPGWIEAGGVGGVPASHMNFIIANQAVILPVYGEGLAASLAAQGLAEVFPGREVIALPSNALLTGGGSFHCISQQEPA
jgi:agmatine deiminase